MERAIYIIFIVFLAGCTSPTPQHSLELMDSPSDVKAGDEFTITWKVNAVPATSLAHTAIHYSTESNPGEYSLDATPALSGYPSLTPEYASGNFSIPDTFSANVTAPNTSKIYFRVHAVIDGKNYWTLEYAINVEGMSQPIPGTLQGEVIAPQAERPPQLPATKEFSIQADDSGYYINNQKTTTISADSGNLVTINFTVKQAGTYYGGLDFRGCGHDTDDIKPGDSVSIQFTASSACGITSYWPVSNFPKSTLQVTVS